MLQFVAVWLLLYEHYEWCCESGITSEFWCGAIISNDSWLVAVWRMEAEQWCLVRQEELDMIRRKDILGKQQLGRVKSIVLRLSVCLSQLSC